MSTICAEIPRSTVRDADIVLSKIGMSFRVQAAIDEIDFDPSPAYATIDQLITAAETIREGAPLDCASVLMSWSGPAASAACDVASACAIRARTAPRLRKLHEISGPMP